MPARVPILVFANVDRVLPYSAGRGRAEAVRRVLQRLEHAHAPLVLCSSRTRAEIDHLQLELGIHHPFVSECGGAAFVPTGYFDFRIPGTRDVAGYHAIEFGPPHAEVVESLHRVASRERIDVIGFSDMSIEDVARECDLPLLQARLAKLREYGERFRVLSGSAFDRPRLFRALGSVRLRCTLGEPYDHVGAAPDQSVAVGLLRALYKQAFGAVLAVGAGDVGSDEHVRQFFSRRLGANRVQCEEGDLVSWAETIVETVEGLRRRVDH